MAAAIRSKMPSYRCWLSTSLHRLHVRLVLVADFEKLEHDLAEPWAEVIVKAARSDKYTYVVTASTSFGKNVLPRAAALLNASRATVYGGYVPNDMQVGHRPHTILRASFATESHGKEPECIDEAIDSERLKDCLESVEVLKDQMDRMTRRLVHVRGDLGRVTGDLGRVTGNLDRLAGLSSEWLARDMIVCAGEIWKWAFKKKGRVGGNGRHLFDPSVQGLVQRAAVGMTMTHDIDAMKEISRVCIVAKNDAVHLNTVEELENLVRFCENGMSMFPHLEVSHPNQWYTINKYWSLKAVLHESFKNE